MNKRIYYIIMTNILALGLCSCGDFLEPQIKNEFTPKTAESLNEMLLGSAYPSTQQNTMNTLLEIITDDVTCRPYEEPAKLMPQSPYQSNSTIANSSPIYTWQPRYDEKITNGGFSMDMYTATYGYIMGANAALDYIEDMSGTENEKRDVRAQAYALRGYLYFHLVNIYGAPYSFNKDGLGVPLKLSSNLDKDPLLRNTVKEVYDQIVSDLTKSEEEYKAMGDAHVWKKNYRLSLPAVQLLLSRVYLYMENWAKAAEYANIVMTQYPQFALLDLNTLPVPSKSTDYYDFMTYSSPETIWLFGCVDDQTKFSAAKLDLGLGQDNSTDSSLNPTFYISSPELTKSFGQGDLRLDQYIVSEIYKPEEGLKRAYGKVNILSYSKGSTPNTSNTYFGRALRLSEAYLNYAEAAAMMAKNGDAKGISQAVDALNTLRRNRIDPDNYKAVTFTGADELVSFVRDERRREFCFEGQRWFDLRRYGMPSFTHTWIDNNNKAGKVCTLQTEDPWYAIPLLISLLNANPNLVQNPMGNLGDERIN